MFLFNYILYILKASIILNVKVVPNDIFKFGGERVNVLFSIITGNAYTKWRRHIGIWLVSQFLHARSILSTRRVTWSPGFSFKKIFKLFIKPFNTQFNCYYGFDILFCSEWEKIDFWKQYANVTHTDASMSVCKRLTDTVQSVGFIWRVLGSANTVYQPFVPSNFV